MVEVENHHCHFLSRKDSIVVFRASFVPTGTSHAHPGLAAFAVVEIDEAFGRVYLRVSDLQ